MRLYTPLFIITLFTTISSAHATLGESVKSVEIDRGLVKAAKAATVTPAERYTVHELESDTGTIREYANAAGIVFGIAWSGARTPELAPLLGTYAKDFSEAEAAKTKEFGKRMTEIAGRNVTVQKWGHMRNISGRAFDPALLPTGVTVDEIE
jgi:hypothetical protein